MSGLVVGAGMSPTWTSLATAIVGAITAFFTRGNVQNFALGMAGTGVANLTLLGMSKMRDKAAPKRNAPSLTSGDAERILSEARATLERERDKVERASADEAPARNGAASGPGRVYARRVFLRRA